MIFIFPEGKCTEGYYLSSGSKIDPLCDEFTFAYFRSLYPDNSEADFKVLYNSVKKILKEMCEQGGRDTEKDLYGQKGKYITQLSKNTLYEPCIKCGHEIHKANFLGGTVYYCENCQKK